MFLGREKELKLIESVFAKPSAFVIVYGTRRVGKTSILKQSVKTCRDKSIYFECRAGTLDYNVGLFLDVLEENGFVIERGKLTNFDRIFSYINSFTDTFNVIIDEYPYLRRAAKGVFVDSIFQCIADNNLKNIRLFISGSDIGMMKELNTYGNALFGRATLILEVKQWDYKEASLCYPDLSPYDKVAFYSVFGGTPFLNTTIDPGKPLRANIIDLYLMESGAARVYAEQIVQTSSNARTDLEPILAVLGNGRRKYGEIKSATKSPGDSVFNSHLDAALDLDLIEKIFPINRDGDAKKASYEISDNVLRFYYTFIYRHKGDLYDMSAESFYDKFIEPSLTTFISHRFEDICRTYFKNIVKSGKYNDACRVGRYYYDDSVAKINGEFDVAVKREPYNGIYCYDIYESKYYSTPLSPKHIMYETEQILNINEINVENIGFVSVNGFEDDCTGILITGEDLYK